MAVAVGTHVGPRSEEDLLALPDGGQRYELLEGTLLIRRPQPGGANQLISLALG